jgi:iron complex outermembrane receptor protein
MKSTRQVMTPVAALGIVLMWCGAGAAQTARDATDSAAAPQFKTEIVVTAERGEAPRDRVGAATVVLDADALPPLPVTDLGELTSFIPGFAVVRPHFHVDAPIVSARGFFGGGEAEYLRLLVDGVPVSDVESGLIDWSAFPTSAIRRVEAVRGPAASLYGDSATGGVIHILTDRAAPGGQLAATAGSFGTVAADGSYGTRTARAGLFFSGSARRTGGGIEHSAGHEYTGRSGVDHRTGALSWRWNASADTRTRETPGALSRTAFVVDPYAADPLYALDQVDRSRASASLTLRADSPVLRPTARIQASIRDENRIRTIPLVAGIGDRQARALDSTSFGGSLEAETTRGAARPLTIRTGVDIVREALNTRYRPVDALGTEGAVEGEADGRRLRTGLFASSAWDVARRARLTGSVRWDRVDDDEFGAAAGDTPTQRAWTARAGIAVPVADEGRVSLFSQVSRAFKAPTLEQLFDPRPYPDFMGGTFTIANRRLVPQRATNVEAGVTGGDRVRWSALAYHMDVDDEIDFDLRTFSYANIGRSRHRGLELEASVRMPRIQPAASYALTHVTGDTDAQLKNVPRHRLALSAQIDLGPAGGAFLRYGHSRGAFLDDDNAFPIHGPSSLDMRLRRDVGRHLVFFDALNLTGDRYEEFGFTLPDVVGQPLPFVYAGAPRALRAGVTIRY